MNQEERKELDRRSNTDFVTGPPVIVGDKKPCDKLSEMRIRCTGTMSVELYPKGELCWWCSSCGDKVQVVSDPQNDKVDVDHYTRFLQSMGNMGGGLIDKVNVRKLTEEFAKRCPEPDSELISVTQDDLRERTVTLRGRTSTGYHRTETLTLRGPIAVHSKHFYTSLLAPPLYRILDPQENDVIYLHPSAPRVFKSGKWEVLSADEAAKVR